MFDKGRERLKDTVERRVVHGRESCTNPRMTERIAMTLRRGLTACLMSMVLIAPGCDLRATPDECKAACDNVSRVGHAEVELKIAETQDLAESGEGRMARSMASAMVDAIRDECMKQCQDKGTRELTECLSTSEDVEAINHCL